MFRPKFVRAAIIAAAAAVTLTWVVFTAMGEGANAPNGRLGGDFPAFYSAGRLVLEGRGHQVYEPESLREIQAPLLPDSDSYLKFAYPPFVACIYAPLAVLPYRAAYVAHTGLMALLLLLCVCRLSIHHDWLLSASSLVVFYPLADALRGGQNTVLTLTLVVAAVYFAQREKHLRAGLFTGVMLFKPQLFLPFALALLLLYRSRRFALGISISASLLYGLGASILGWNWPSLWIERAILFRSDDFVQGNKLISLPQQLEALGLLQVPTVAVLGLYLVGVTAALWLLARTRAWLGFVATTLLFLPHAVYYDAGLLALGWPAFLLGSQADSDARLRSCVALVAMGLFIWVSGTLGTLFCAAVAVWSFARSRRVEGGSP